MNAFDTKLDTWPVLIKVNLMYDARKLKHKVLPGLDNMYTPHFKLLVKRLIQCIEPWLYLMIQYKSG